MKISAVTFFHPNFFITCFIAAIMLVFVRSLTLQNCTKICYASHAVKIIFIFYFVDDVFVQAVIKITQEASRFLKQTQKNNLKNS